MKHRGTLLLLLAAASCAAPQAGPPIELAQRYLALNGGAAQLALSMHIRLLKSERCKSEPTCAKTAKEKFAAVQQAIANNDTFLREMDLHIAEAIAQVSSREDLRDYLAFWDTPTGRSILAARISDGQLFWTAEAVAPTLDQKTADRLQRYLASPAGRRWAEQEKRVEASVIRLNFSIQFKITNDAADIYCKQTGDCTPWIHQTRSN